MKRHRIYVCEDSLEGILTAVHFAYMSRYGHEYQSIQAGDYAEPSLFSEMIYVDTDMEKASRVADAIIKKISWYAWHMVMHGAMACDEDKADAVYRFLIRGFRVGSCVTEQFADPAVMRLVKLLRAVQREELHVCGFIRFRELADGVLFADFAPKHHQLPLIAEHFSDRYPMENWIIYDERRHEACVHQASSDWWITKDAVPDQRKIMEVSDDQRAFEIWWKDFYDAIGITERENPSCRMRMMPKMYWRNMTEMMGK